MPTYDYICENCKHTLEVFQKITEEPLTLCPACKQQTLRSRPGGGIGLAFKGSGFYINDYSTEKKEPRPCEKDKTGPEKSGPSCGCKSTHNCS
jgi:putative FmdB family regulatory protein